MDTPNRPPSMVVPRAPKRASVFAPRCSAHSQVTRKIAFYDTTDKIKSDKVEDLLFFVFYYFVVNSYIPIGGW